MHLLPSLFVPILLIGGFVYLFVQRSRERDRNAPLRREVEARVCFEAILDRASFLGTGGFGAARGYWIPLRGPKRLIVGSDAFIISAPHAFREFVLAGRESSIALARIPALLTDRDRDWVVITGQTGGRQVRLAISRNNLPEIWQALAGTGVTLLPAAGGLDQPGKLTYGLDRVRGRRRFALSLVLVAVSMFGPALVLFIAHHLP